MEPEALRALSILRAATALLGTLIVAYGARAYLRSRGAAMLWFTIGVAVVTLGFLLEGILFELFGWTLEGASAIEASITFVAFLLLVASLFVRDRHVARHETI